MRVNTDTFNAIWTRTDIMGSFGFLIIEHHDGRNWSIPGTLEPRGQEGLITKAQWCIDNRKPTSVGEGKDRWTSEMVGPEGKQVRTWCPS